MLFFFLMIRRPPRSTLLSLHDALPICLGHLLRPARHAAEHDARLRDPSLLPAPGDRKSTRLNSSHGYISYAVFCLKKKKHLAGPPSPQQPVTCPPHALAFAPESTSPSS